MERTWRTQRPWSRCDIRMDCKERDTGELQWSNLTARPETMAATFLHDSETTIRYFHVHTLRPVYVHWNTCTRALFGQVRCMTHSLTSPEWNLNFLPSTLQTAYVPLHHQDPALPCISCMFEGNIVGHRSLICQSCHVLKFDWWWMNEELGDHYHPLHNSQIVCPTVFSKPLFLALDEKIMVSSKDVKYKS